MVGAGLALGGGGAERTRGRSCNNYGPRFPDVCNQENVIVAKHEYR